MYNNKYVETFYIICRIIRKNQLNREKMTTVRKNQFEELIDAMMIEEVSGLDQDIRETLEGLDTDKKRMAILSILDKDRDMFMKIKGIVGDNSVTKAEHIKNVVAMLRDYVKVGEVEKKTLGEVMTPNFLVNDMLNTLPEEVWSNPDLKWLDPCSGVGVFACVIVERLMDGLKGVISGDEDRYKHIVENMLYVGELQPKNMFLFLCAFDPRDEYDMNIYTGSFLVEDFDNHSKNVWGIEKFDVIVQNPPYQEQKEGNIKTQPLWHLFVQKAFSLLINGGYHVAVHPTGWRNIDGRFKDTQMLLKNKQVEYLEIHSFKDGLKTFGAKIDYDFYCIKNVDNNGYLTTIKCVNGVVEQINISILEFIPSENIELVHSLVAKSGEETVNIFSDSSYHTQKTELMQKTQDETFNYPCVYMVKFGLNLVFWYSKLNKGVHFGVPKVIWGNGATDVLIDDKGQYGLTQFAYAIVDDVNNLENIKKALDNPKFVKDIMGYRDGLGDKYNRKIIATFRKDFWKEFLD